MSVTADVIGYWARYHNLTYADVNEEEVLSALLTTADEEAFEAAGRPNSYKEARLQFQEGWDECNEELKAERIKLLKDSLSQAAGEDIEIQSRKRQHGKSK